MSASRNSDRKPLSSDALRRVMGGQGDNNRDRPEPAVLLEQSIVASEAPPPEEAEPAESAVMATIEAEQTGPDPAWVSEEMARLGVDEIGDFEAIEHEEPDVAPEQDVTRIAEEGLVVDTEGETIDEARLQAAEAGLEPLDPVPPPAEAPTDDPEALTAEAPDEPAPRQDAAPPEPVREVAEAPISMQDEVPALPAAPATVDFDPALAVVAAKLAAAKAKPAPVVIAPEAEPLVYMTQSRMNFDTPHGRAILAKAFADPFARIVNAQRYILNHPDLDAARASERSFIQAKAQYEASLKEHEGQRKAGVKDTSAFKAKVERAEEALMKAGRDFSGRLVPAKYVPYERMAVADPWERERTARADLVKAIKTGTAADVQKAQDRLNAAKLPPDAAGKLKLFDGQKKTIERKIMATMMKIQGVEDRVKSITPMKERADNNAAKNIAKQGSSIERQGDKMASLTYHANKFLSPQMASFLDNKQFAARGDMELRMAAHYKGELLKDLHKLNLDLARVETFREVAQQSKPVPVTDLGDANAKVDAAHKEWNARTGEVGTAIKASNGATEATKTATAEAGKTLKTLHEKMAAMRAADPTTNMAVQAMERAQKMEGGLLGLPGGLPGISLFVGLPYIPGLLPMMPSTTPGVSLKHVADAQANFDQKMKVRGEKEAALKAGYEAVGEKAGWGANIKNDNDNSAEGRFRAYAATTKDAARQVKEFAKANTEAVEAYRALASLKAKLPEHVRAVNMLGKQIDLVQLGAPLALKAAEAEYARTGAAAKQVDALKPKLQQDARIADAARDHAKQQLDITARTLFKAYVDKAPGLRIEFLNYTMNDQYTKWYAASKAAAKVHADIAALPDHPAHKAHAEAGEILKNARGWAAQSVEFARLDSEPVKQAKQKAAAEVAKAWEAHQASLESVKAKMKAELDAANAVGQAAANAQGALQKIDEAVDAKNALEIRILSGEVSVKNGAQTDFDARLATAKGKAEAADKIAMDARETYLKATQGPVKVDRFKELDLARHTSKAYQDARAAKAEYETLRTSGKAIVEAQNKALAELFAGVALTPGTAAAKAGVPGAVEAPAKTTVPAAAEAPPKATPDAKALPDAKAEAKAALEALRSGHKLSGGGKATVTGEIKKEMGSPTKVTPWGTVYQQAALAAAKEGKAAPTKAEVDTKTQKKALESLKESVTSKSHELVGALGRDIGQDIARELAVKAGTNYKVGKDMMLAGEIFRTTVFNGTTKITALAQVSMKTGAEAYYSNLGAHGSAGFGLKFDTGAAIDSKVALGGGASTILGGKAYLGGGVDLSAKGGANILGASADLVAKAHANGEVSGMAGFAFGEHVELSQGGQANADAEAQASAGAKLGADGGSIKLSASADASVRAAFLQKAKLGMLNYTGTMEAWAKARAEAVASVSAGMVSGEFKLGAKLGASAGAGAGLQETKKINISGVEFEATLGVHAGTLGASAGVDVGYKNGVLRWSVDVGAALGVGINFKIGGSIDFVEAAKGAVKFFADIARLFDARLAHQMEVSAWKDMARRGVAIFN